MITGEKALDILDRMDFFQGQRAGRELWNDKPYEVQEEDIKGFSRDVAELKAYIADVVPKSEVAQILENNQMCLEIIEIQDQTIQIAKANIARLQTLPRKIFEEIERLLAVYSYTDEYGKEVIGVDVEELIAELKKKYIGEKE